MDFQPAGRSASIESERNEEVSLEGSLPSLPTSSFHSTWAQEVELNDALEQAAKANDEKMEKEAKEAEKRERRRIKDNRVENEKKAELVRQTEQRRREELKKLTKEKEIKKMESILPPKEEKNVKKGMKKLRKWFGIETESGTETSTESDTDDSEDWNQVDRKKRNKQKIKLQEKNKAHKQAMNASRASHIIGLSPIHPETITGYMNKGLKFEQAKLAAVKNYLQFYLKFDDEEIENMDIKETMTAAKGDDTLYVAFMNKGDIREIHLRMAECGNSELNSRNYIPPGFYARYMAANRRCTEVRLHSSNTKTQIRFGEQDIDVLVKERGTDEPYRSVDLKEFMGEMELPPFDHSRRWIMRLDRPPRRKIVYDTPAADPLAVDKPSTKHPISRQNSWKNSKRSRGAVAEGMEVESGSGSESPVQ